jgi:hypothetical protein
LGLVDPVVIYSSSSVYHPGDGDASCLATTVADTRTARLVAPRFFEAVVLYVYHIYEQWLQWLDILILY